MHILIYYFTFSMCLVCAINAMSMWSGCLNESSSLDGSYMYKKLIAQNNGFCYDDDTFCEYVTYTLQSMCSYFSITLTPYYCFRSFIEPLIGPNLSLVLKFIQIQVYVTFTLALIFVPKVSTHFCTVDVVLNTE